MACLKLGTKWAIKETLKTLEDISFCRFVHDTATKQFGNDDWKPCHNGMFRWHWNLPETRVQTSGISFDGIPFVCVGHLYMGCQYGVDNSKKPKPGCGSLKKKHKTRTQKSIKNGCPARIKISRVAKFPQFKLTNDITLRKKYEVIEALRRSLRENPSSVNWYNLYYFSFPTFKEHIGHPVTFQAKNMNPRSNGLKKPVAEFETTCNNGVELASLLENLDEVQGDTDPATSPLCTQSSSILRKPVSIIVETDDFTHINLPETAFSQFVSPSVVEIAFNEDISES